MRAPASLSEPVPGFERQGEIQFTPAGTAGSSAAWDARSVRGPAVNLTLTDEGLWGGTLRDRAVLLEARGGRITGEGVNLFVTQDGPVVHVQGLWFGSLFRLDLGPETLSAAPTSSACGIELALAPDGLWRGFGGCGGTLNLTWMNLKGVAADPAAEMPQWFFAFLGALPAPRVSTFRADAAVAVVAGGPSGWFLPAQFPGPAQWSRPPLPCSACSQEMCGPLGFDWGLYRDWLHGDRGRGDPALDGRTPRPVSLAGRTGGRSQGPVDAGGRAVRSSGVSRSSGGGHTSGGNSPGGAAAGAHVTRSSQR
jgi:hypothetical protein